MSQAKAIERSTNAHQKDNNSANLVTDRDFHGAAIIDENGNEIPITEDMIQDACRELSSAWLFPRQEQPH